MSAKQCMEKTRAEEGPPTLSFLWRRVSSVCVVFSGTFFREFLQGGMLLLFTNLCLLEDDLVIFSSIDLTVLVVQSARCKFSILN